MTSQVIVDGYNVIHAWTELRAVLDSAGVTEARRALLAVLAEYRALTGTHVIVVFDGRGTAVSGVATEVVDGVEVRFSTARGSADAIIEQLAYDARRRAASTSVVVVTGDRVVRDIARGADVPTMDARTFESEVRAVLAEVGRTAARLRAEVRYPGRIERQLGAGVLARLEALRRGLPETLPQGTSGVSPEDGPEVERVDPPGERGDKTMAN